jgi:hypothetical protein
MADSQAPPGAASGFDESLKAVGRDVREEGARLVETVKSDAVKAAERRKSEAAGYLSDITTALHAATDRLRENRRDASASLVQSAAEELDRLSGGLKSREVDELWSEFEAFAHRRPGLLFGAAMIAGFGAMRFAMSARPRHPAGEGGHSDRGPRDRSPGEE